MPGDGCGASGSAALPPAFSIATASSDWNSVLDADMVAL